MDKKFGDLFYFCHALSRRSKCTSLLNKYGTLNHPGGLISMIILFLVSPENGQKTCYKHGIVGGVADKSAFVVNLGHFPHFETKQHSPSKD